jgi:hypothetical protein
MVDLRQMLLEAAVPAAEIPSIRVGQTTRFNVGGFGEREFTGEVQRISPTTVQGSRAITIYIAVPNADRALKGGMFAQGQLVIDSNQPVLSIPQMAARDEAGASFVYTLEDGKIVRKSVTLGHRMKGQDFVEVREGLTAGERVIVADIGEAKPGSVTFVTYVTFFPCGSPASVSSSPSSRRWSCSRSSCSVCSRIGCCRSSRCRTSRFRRSTLLSRIPAPRLRRSRTMSSSRSRTSSTRSMA